MLGAWGRAKGKNIPLSPEVTTSCGSVRKALARPFAKLRHYQEIVALLG